MRLAETHLGREGAVCPEPIPDAGDVLGEYRPGASHANIARIFGYISRQLCSNNVRSRSSEYPLFFYVLQLISTECNQMYETTSLRYPFPALKL